MLARTVLQLAMVVEPYRVVLLTPSLRESWALA